MNIYSTEVLKSNLYHFNDDYILVRGDIVTTAHDYSTPVAFKNCVSFIKCTTKIDGTTIDDAEDWDLVMSMKNLIEYSSNFSETTESLCFILRMKKLNLMQLLLITVLNLSSVRLNY